jgi:hypothetical protein
MAELTATQRERIAAQLREYALFICPMCLPVLGVDVTGEHWRLVVDHSRGCPEFARRLVGDDPPPPDEFEQIVRALELDTDPGPDKPEHPQEGSST